MKDVTIIVISCDAKQDDFMHTVDLFEPSKRFGEITTMTATVNDKFNATTGLLKIKEGLENIGRFVSAVFIPGDSESAYIDPSVRSISIGTKWTTLENILTQYGIKYEHQ